MLAILGAGGHGRVIADAWKDTVQFYDDNKADYPNICDLPKGIKFIVGIGNNRDRKHFFYFYRDHRTPISVIHETATISGIVSCGTFVGAGAIIQVNVHVGQNCIINTGAQIDHDCIIEDHAHIAPGAVLCGGVHVGEGALVGANATVLPNQKVPSWSTIRAGSVFYERPNE